MSIPEPTNILTAFLVGAITSPHCIVMCGPLAFVVLSGKPSLNAQSKSLLPLYSYHLTRILVYALVGILAGALSLKLLTYWQMTPVKYFPWALVLLLTIFALGLETWIPKFQLFKRFTSNLTLKATMLPKPIAGVILGILTPLLPCGPLYLIFWIALLSGSPLYGATVCLGFGIGTIPLMILTQTQLSKYQHKINPRLVHTIQRIIAAIASIILIWRLLMNDSPLQAEWCCPW